MIEPPRTTIPYRLVPHRRGMSIFVKCPKCGEWGRLLKNGTKLTGRKYAIQHAPHYNRGPKCYVPPSHPAQPALDAIYRAVREVSHDGL